jgi:RimJ/RimL family protein N-acetyltransferase
MKPTLDASQAGATVAMRDLLTARLVLEPQVASHADEMFAVVSDPAIYEFENAPPASLEALRKRYRALETRRSADGSELWLNWVVRVRNGPAIGYVQVTVREGGRALVAYELHSAHWRRGYGTEALAAMIAELRVKYGVTSFAAVFKRANFRSRGLLERVGMRTAPAGLAAGWAPEPDEDLYAM